MPVATCFASLQLCGARIAELDASGSPIPGAGRGYMTTSPIKAEIKVELEKGDEFTQKNGAGAICAQFKDCDRVKRVNITLELCQLDSDLISLLVGGSTFSSAGKVIGMQMPSVTAADCDNGTSLELWSKAWDGTAQAVPAFTTPNPAYFHWVFPKVTWSLGDITLENGVATIPVVGNGVENSRITANGPFDDWPVAVAGAGGVTRVAGWWLDATLPTASCGSISVTSAAS